jgi:hypothetical protein
MTSSSPAALIFTPGCDVPRQVTSVRILPMSDKLKGFRDRSTEEVQAYYFLDRVPAGKGRFPYRSSGLNAPSGTVVLFQFRARIIATAVFLRDEKFGRPKAGHGGVLHFEPDSFQTFDPLDVESVRKAWPRFRGFGRVKQSLNPVMYPAFKRRLKNVRRFKQKTA